MLYLPFLRGRVHGPFETTRIKELVRKGTFQSTANEISEDGSTWRAASTMPELFERVKRLT